MKKARLSVSTEAGKTWAYQERSPGKWLDTPLYPRLQWLVKQMNLGNVTTEADDNGEVVTVSVGRAGAATDEVPPDEVSEEAYRRILAVAIKGLSGFPNPCLLMQCLEFNDKHGLRSHC